MPPIRGIRLSEPAKVPALLGKLNPPRLLIISGPPGSGKTSLATSIANNPTNFHLPPTTTIVFGDLLWNNYAQEYGDKARAPWYCWTEAEATEKLRNNAKIPTDLAAALGKLPVSELGLNDFLIDMYIHITTELKAMPGASTLVVEYLFQPNQVWPIVEWGSAIGLNDNSFLYYIWLDVAEEELLRRNKKRERDMGYRVGPTLNEFATQSTHVDWVEEV